MVVHFHIQKGVLCVCIHRTYHECQGAYEKKLIVVTKAIRGVKEAETLINRVIAHFYVTILDTKL